MKKIIVLLTALLLLTSFVYSSDESEHFRGYAPASLNPGLPGGGNTDEDSTFYHSTYETGMEGWTTQDLTVQTNHWNIDQFNAYQGNSWWCGDSSAGASGIMGYDNFWLQYMDSPVLNLTGAVSPTLTFKVYWSMESYSSVPPPPPYNGWDGCNVWISTNGGSTFAPLTPVSPTYSCTSLSSFGTVWRMGPNIPGWAGDSGGWLDAQFNLSAYATNNVIIRFALASDRAVSSATGHPELLGFFVDNVTLSAGDSTYLYNDADSTPIPAPFTFEQGDPFGDWWVMTDLTSYSPTHCMVVDDDHFFINNALISPPIILPDNYTLWFEYAVLCDLPDSTHGTSTALRDYYFVDLTADGGLTWENQFYDYARSYSYPNWGVCEPDTPYTGNIAMDLSQWGGQTVQLRFRCVTDGDHTTGNGSGLHIDDMWIIGNNLLANDCGAASLHIPFPTSAGFQIGCSVDLHNYGLNAQSSVMAFFKAGAFTVPLAPWVAIPPESSVPFNFNWTPTAAGDYICLAYTQLSGDMNPANDTTFAGTVTVNEENLYELGYDNREGMYYYEFDPGSGPLVKFSPPFSTTSWFTLHQVSAQFNGDLTAPVEFTAHFYNQGTATTPGTEFRSETFTVSPAQTYPNWWSEDLVFIPGQSNYTGDVWVWFEITDGNAFPHTIGHPQLWGDGHYFSYNGSASTAYDDDLLIRLTIYEGGVGVEDNPAQTPGTFALHPAYPNPFNASTVINFDLPAASDINLAVYDITGREVAAIGAGHWASGQHSAVWNASGQASGVYFVRLTVDGGPSMVRKVVLMK